MKIIICGAGLTCKSILNHLAQELDNNIVVIDCNNDSAEYFERIEGVQFLQGYCSYPHILKKAGAEQADIIIAITGSDELNIVACQVAHHLFNIPIKIARIRTDYYNSKNFEDIFSYNTIPIDFHIYPEMDIAYKIIQQINLFNNVDYISLHKEAISFFGLKCQGDTSIANVKVGQLSFIFKDITFFICAIVRDDKFIFVDYDKVILSDDILYICCLSADMHRVMTIFGYNLLEAKKVVIFGGNHIGSIIANKLQKYHNDINVVIIEKDKKIATNLANELNCMVINSSFQDIGVLNDVGIGSTDLVIAATSDDSINILSSVISKKLGASKNLTLINNLVYKQLANSLNIDIVIDPSNIINNSMLSYIRRGCINHSYAIHDGSVELLEIEITSNAYVCNKYVNSIKMKLLNQNTVIVTIYRDNKLLSVNDGTVFLEGDCVIILTKVNAVQKVEMIFSIDVDYF